MVWPALGVFCLLLTISGSAKAQTVPATPTPSTAPVAEEQHPIQVGDVIMAPAIEGPEDEPERVPAALRPQPRRWYGAPILIGDAVTYGSIALAVTVEDTASVALPIGIGAFLLAGPITHGVHRQWGRMGLSVAARTVLPFAGLLLGAGSCLRDGDCSSVAAGVITGMAAATVIDSAVLAYEPVAAAPTVQPLLSLSRDRLWLGAGGTF